MVLKRVGSVALSLGLLWVAVTAPAQAAPIDTGLDGSGGYFLDSQANSSGNNQTVIGISFTPDASQTSLSDFSFFLLNGEFGLTPFQVTAVVAPFTGNVAGAPLFSSNVFTSTALTDGNGNPVEEVTFSTPGVTLTAGDPFAIWLTGAFSPTGSGGTAFGTSTSFPIVFAQDGGSVPNQVATSVADPAFHADFGLSVVGAPEVDPASGCAPVALLLGVGLVVAERRRSLSAEASPAQ